MRIGITCYPTYGGSGVVATELGKRLSERGNEVHFVSYALPYRLTNFASKIFFHEVEVIHYPLFEYPPYSLALASKMAEVFEFQKLDIMHVHYAIPHATSAYLARQILEDKNIRFVTTLHGTDITLLGGDPSFFKITKFSIEQSSGVTAVSEFLKNKTIEVLNPKKEIEVIPNFVPFEFGTIKTNKEIRQRFASDDEKILIHISNFRSLKRVTDIVPIIKKVSKKHRVKMLMVGDGPDRYKTEEQCRNENLCDKVIFLGKQENISELLSIADIALIPSESESFGLVALEALACGTPCVSTNAGGLPEVNLDGKTGFTVNIGDIEGFAEAIDVIFSDNKLAKEMGKQGMEIATSKFSPEIIVPKYIDYYEKILSD